MTDSALPPLIGLYSPAARSGKSSAAHILHTEHGYRILPLATPIKRMARTFLQSLGYSLPTIDRLITTDKETLLPELRITPRHIFRTLGTEWGRQCIHPDIWLHCWRDIAGPLLRDHIPIVCDDVRFPNEADFLRSLGGQLWYIHRPSTERDTTHASEGSLDGYPFFSHLLVNDGTLSDLYTKVHDQLLPSPP